MRRSKLRRAGSIAAAYLLVAALAVLGWLWHSLPAEILLEPGQTLTLPRFAYVQPLRTAGSRNAASTQAAGSYQASIPAAAEEDVVNYLTDGAISCADTVMTINGTEISAGAYFYWICLLYTSPSPRD